MTVRNTKSARRAQPSWSIRILALRNEIGSVFKGAPLQITMYHSHSLIMHVYQPPSDVSGLLERLSMGDAASGRS